MSFFDAPIPPPPPEPRREIPEWAGCPPGVVPGMATDRLVLVRTDQVAVVVHRFLCYPTGIEFTIDVWWRSDAGVAPEVFAGPPGAGMGRTESELMVGVEYPDGLRWTSRAWRPPVGDDMPDPPVVMFRGGSASDLRRSQRLWMWPLPTEGTLTFAVAWPELDIEESRGSLHTGSLRAAAAEAEALW